MRYLTPDEVVRLHGLILDESGGADGITSMQLISPSLRRK